MRIAEELIGELDQEQRDQDARTRPSKSEITSKIRLVVGFDKESLMIGAEQEDRLKLLNDAIKAGGEPIGLIMFQRARIDGDDVECASSRVYPDYEGDEREAEQLLRALSSARVRATTKL